MLFDVPCAGVHDVRVNLEYKSLMLRFGDVTTLKGVANLVLHLHCIIDLLQKEAIENQRRVIDV